MAGGEGVTLALLQRGLRRVHNASARAVCARTVSSPGAPCPGLEGHHTVTLHPPPPGWEPGPRGPGFSCPSGRPPPGPSVQDRLACAQEDLVEVGVTLGRCRPLGSPASSGGELLCDENTRSPVQGPGQREAPAEPAPRPPGPRGSPPRAPRGLLSPPRDREPPSGNCRSEGTECWFPWLQTSEFVFVANFKRRYRGCPPKSAPTLVREAVCVLPWGPCLCAAASGGRAITEPRSVLLRCPGTSSTASPGAARSGSPGCPRWSPPCTPPASPCPSPTA